MQSLFDTCSAVLQDRVEMFKLELEEEKRRYARLFLCWGIAMVCAMNALLLTTGVIIFLFSPEFRWGVALGLGVLYWGIVLLLLKKARTLWSHSDPPFSATLEELKKDYEWLKSIR